MPLYLFRVLDCFALLVLLISESFLYSIVVDFSVILVVWLEIIGALFLIYSISLFWDLPTCVCPWISYETWGYVRFVMSSLTYTLFSWCIFLLSSVSNVYLWRVGHCECKTWRVSECLWTWGSGRDEFTRLHGISFMGIRLSPYQKFRGVFVNKVASRQQPVQCVMILVVCEDHTNSGYSECWRQW